MLLDKHFKQLEKNGITFELSKNGKFANMYFKGKFVETIFGTKNAMFFCGKDFVRTTSKDVLEFLNNN